MRGADGRRRHRRWATSCWPAAPRPRPPTSTSSRRYGPSGSIWAQTTFWIGDERCVDPDDERSNYRMIKESLLDPLAEPDRPTIHRIKGELGPDAGRRRLRAHAARRRAADVRPGAAGDRPGRPHRARCSPARRRSPSAARLVVGVPEAGPRAVRPARLAHPARAGQRPAGRVPGRGRVQGRRGRARVRPRRRARPGRPGLAAGARGQAADGADRRRGGVPPAPAETVGDRGHRRRSRRDQDRRRPAGGPRAVGVDDRADRPVEPAGADRPARAR